MRFLRKRSDSQNETALLKIAVKSRRALRRASPLKTDQIDPLASGIIAATEILRETLVTLDAFENHLRAMAQIAVTTLGETDLGARAMGAENFEDLHAAVPSIIDAANTNLVSPGAEPICVELAGFGRYILAPWPIDPDHSHFHIPLPKGAFGETAEINDTLSKISETLRNIDRARTIFDRDLRFLMQQVTDKTLFNTDEQSTKEPTK